MGKRLLRKHEELSSKPEKPRKTERCDCICSPVPFHKTELGAEAWDPLRPTKLAYMSEQQRGDPDLRWEMETNTRGMT